MMDNTKTALFSVYHKKGSEVFARELLSLGWQIFASGGTAKYLKENNIPIKDVAELVGGAAILGHRVMTLSREVHAGLLSRNIPEDIEEMERLGLPRIDLVCCDFYPLAAEIAKPDCTVESVIEKTDIGGPTMVRSGAKGGRIVICDPPDRQIVINQLKTKGDIDKETRQYLRAKAEAAVSVYCLDSARFHSKGSFDGILGRIVSELAYGENRDQSPAFLHSSNSDDPLAWNKFKVVSGVPGFINMADGDRTLQVLCLMAESFRRNFKGKVPYIAIACKHGNPCGAAIDWDEPVKALNKTLLGDPIAVMGAEVMTNFEITNQITQALYRVSEEYQVKVGREFWGIDVVFAPAFDDKAIELLGKRERRRLLVNSALADPTMPIDEWAIRPVRGGFLRQKAPQFIFDRESAEEWTGRNSLEPQDFAALIVAWAAAWRADSNTIMLAKDNMLIGSGVGQKDRTACCSLALWYAKRAGHSTEGSVFASDAFFPYAQREREKDSLESPEILVQAGCIGGVVQADGKNLQQVKEFFNFHNMAVAFLAKEHRGFSQH